MRRQADEAAVQLRVSCEQHRDGHAAWIAINREGDGLLARKCRQPSDRECRLRETTLEPGDFGLEAVDEGGLLGGNADDNAAFARELFAGATGAGRNAVIMETAVALRACGIASDFLDGAKRAQEAIDTGAATRKLADLVALSNGG